MGKGCTLSGGVGGTDVKAWWYRCGAHSSLCLGDGVGHDSSVGNDSGPWELAGMGEGV